MANRDTWSQEIMVAAQRYVISFDSTELEEYSLEELRKADLQFSDRDEKSGYRMAVRDFIYVLEYTPGVFQCGSNFYGSDVDYSEIARRLKSF